MSSEDVATALRVTPLFYRAALDPAVWGTALAALCDVFSARAAQFSIGRIAARDVILTSVHGLSPEELKPWLEIEDFSSIDPRVPRMANRPNSPFTERTIMPLEEWTGSVFFRDYMEPAGLDSTLCTGCEFEDEGLYAAIGCIRALGAEPFGEADVQRMHLYHPHFREASKCAVRLQRLSARQRTLAGLFDLWRLPAIVTDRFGEIVFANRAADGCLGQGGPLGTASGRIIGPTPECTLALRTAIRDCATGPSEALGPVLRVPRRVGRDVVVALLPLSEESELRHLHLAALLVLDPDQTHEPDAEVLQRLFGLTDTEAAVAVALARGEQPRKIAKAMDRAYETVRTHAKSVLAKAGVTSQAQFAAVVQGMTHQSPIGLRSRPGERQTGWPAKPIL